MTETQKRLRKEAGRKPATKKKNYSGTKHEKEEFPYTEEQYEKRVVLGKVLMLFASHTKFTIFVKSYFTDCTTNSCVADMLSRDEVSAKQFLMLYKVGYMNIKGDVLFVTLVRRYNTTADEYFSKFVK